MPPSAPDFPARLPITPVDRPLIGQVRVPGSKSITNRALVLAALCSRTRPALLSGCLQSEDTEVMIAALSQLGYEVHADWNASVPSVSIFRGEHPPVAVPSADLFVANSGTTMRFLTAFVALGEGRYRLDGIPRMRERPIHDLLQALQQLDVDAVSERGNGCPPVVVNARGLPGGRVRIKGDVSSQFLSALLMVAPFARGDIFLEVEGPLVSQPYVDMTVRMMHEWYLRVEQPIPGRQFRIPGHQGPTKVRMTDVAIEPDASAASYFFAAAALTGGRVTIPGLTLHSLQGDVHFVDVLARMGCTVETTSDSLTVTGGPLRGIDVGMSDISDTVMTLAVVACFADGPTTIRNVAHIRHKETDRLTALATELRRLGAGVEEFADGLTILPRPLHGAEVQTWNDHRMAMSLALAGLRVPGVVVCDPGCVTKTYPGYFYDLECLRTRSGS
jgi:3-phosphoshikimate 1-carboxyvinyltransferase